MVFSPIIAHFTFLLFEQINRQAYNFKAREIQEKESLSTSKQCQRAINPVNPQFQLPLSTPCQEKKRFGVSLMRVLYLHC